MMHTFVDHFEPGTNNNGEQERLRWYVRDAGIPIKSLRPEPSLRPAGTRFVFEIEEQYAAALRSLLTARAAEIRSRRIA